MRKTTIAVLAFSVLMIPAALAFADTATGQKFQFQPIVSVPLPTGGSVDANTSLSCYINAVFKLAISISVVLAVIMIVIDGFKYMTSEAVGNKKDALAGIRAALFGLVLLLGSWLILNIINPQITQLSVTSFTGSLSSCGSGVSSSVNSSTSTLTPAGGGGTVPNPLDNPPQATFGSNATANPLTSSLPENGETFGAGSFCFATTGGGSECFSDVTTCNNVRTTVGTGATTGCTDTSTTNTTP